MNVIFDQIVFRKLNNWPTECVQIRVVQRIGQSRYWIRCNQFNVCTAFGQNNFHHTLIDGHIIVDVIDETHFQQIVFVGVEKIFETGHIVTDGVMRSPSTEQWESGTKIQFYRIFVHAHR